MIDRGRKNLLGVWIDAVDEETALARILAAAHAQQPLSFSALAVHGVMTGVLDPAQRYRINHLDLVVPDGQPVRWALNWLHRTKLPERVYGPTLMLNLCQAAAAEGLPIYLYGSQPAVLEALAARLCGRFPGLVIAGMQPSRFRRVTADEQAEIAAQIRASGARLVFVGLGCPRQETWAFEQRDALGVPALAVGAAFDFHAGTLAQAPPMLQRAGLEWLFRLIKEPRRLWRRYVLLNPHYLFLVALQGLRLRRFDPSDAPAPTEELRYG